MSVCKFIRKSGKLEAQTRKYSHWGGQGCSHGDVVCICYLTNKDPWCSIWTPFTMASILVSQHACDRNSILDFCSCHWLLAEPPQPLPHRPWPCRHSPGIYLAKSATAKYVQPRLLGLHPHEKLDLPSMASRRMRAKLHSDSQSTPAGMEPGPGTC